MASWRSLGVACCCALALSACGNASRAPSTPSSPTDDGGSAPGSGGAADAGARADGGVTNEYARCPRVAELFVRVRGDGSEQTLDARCEALGAPYPIAAETGLPGGGDWREHPFVIAGCGSNGSRLVLGTTERVPGIPGDYEIGAVYIARDGARFSTPSGSTLSLTVIAPGQALTETAPLLDATFEGSFAVSFEGGMTLEGEVRACAITMHDQRTLVEQLRADFGTPGSSSIFSL